MFIERYNPLLEEFVDEARAFNASFFARLPQTPRDLSTPAGLAAARDITAYRGLAADAPVVDAEDRVVKAGGRSVAVRVIVPSVTPKAVYLDIHGGGFYLGAASMGDAGNAELARDHEVAVVSVEYRLAPEHPWPAGPDDCETAALWVVERSVREYGAGRLLSGGGSAGAALGAGPLLRLPRPP